MAHVDIHVMNFEGEEVRPNLFIPLFTMLAPGFEAKADELRVEVARSEKRGVVASYSRDGASFDLSVPDDYQPFTASSRIRIICAMSIMPDVPHQQGKMAVRLADRTIPMNVEVLSDEAREIMVFHPAWDTRRPNTALEPTPTAP